MGVGIFPVIVLNHPVGGSKTLSFYEQRRRKVNMKSQIAVF